MGAGLAKAIQIKWPKVYKEYRVAFKDGGIKLGVCQLVRIKPALYVANLIGQDRYGRTARMTNYDAVRLALKSLAEQTKHDIYIPYLMGCGLAGGDWNKVSSIIEEELGQQATIVKYKAKHD